MNPLKSILVLLAGLVLAAVETMAATKTWNGSTAGSWQIASNWIPAGVPANGDALVFPAAATKVLTTNAPGGPTNFTSILIQGAGYELRGPSMMVTNGVTNASPFNSASTVLAPLRPGLSSTWTVNARTTLTLESNIAFSALNLTLDVNGTLRANGNFSGGANANLVKLGNGRLDVNGGNNILNQVRVGDGTLSVDGVLTANVLTVSNGAVLAGSGTVPAFTNAGIVRIGTDFGTVPGQLSVTAPGTAAFLPGSLLQIQVQSPTPGLGHDQLRVANPPNLTHGTLTVLRDAAFPLSLGQKFVIITNTGAAAFTTTFTNLPSGAFITNTVSPQTVFQISYAGGNGNDVELTVVAIAAAPTGIARVWDGEAQPNLNWTNPVNWAANTLPLPGDDLVFPASVIAARRAMGNAFTNGATFNRLTFGSTNASSWSLTGGALKLLGGIVATNGSATAPNTTISAAMELGAPQTFAATNLNLTVFGVLVLGGHSLSLAPGLDTSINLRGSNSGPGNIVMNGNGNLNLGERTSDAAPVTINSGTTTVFGEYAGAAHWTLNGGRLQLQRSKVPTIQVNGGVLAPDVPSSADHVNLVGGDLSLAGATLEVQLLTATDKFGSPLPHLAVTGNLTLNNASLAVIATDISQLGSTHILISNLGPNAVTGAFVGKPEGATFATTNADGFVFFHRISYVGGDGNDVTLTGLAPVPSGHTRIWNGGDSDALWTLPGNWEVGLRPANADAVRFPVNAARRTNANNLPVILDTITWDGSNYMHEGLTVLSGGARAGHVAGTNEITGSVQVIGAQTWAVSNAAATLRLGRGDRGIESFAPAGGLGTSGSLHGTGSILKTGAGVLELQQTRVFLSGGLTVREGTLRLRDVKLTSLGVGTNVGLRLQQGRMDLAEVDAPFVDAIAGEMIVRLVREDGTPALQGVNANAISLAPGVVLTVVGTNNVEVAALVSLGEPAFQIDGAQLNAVLPPGLATGTRIHIAAYPNGALIGKFAGLPEAGVTNFNGNSVQVRYAEDLQPGSDVRSITLTVLPGPPPNFTAFVRVNATTLILNGHASPGANVTLEGTQNFADWTPLGAVVAGVDDFGFVVNPTTLPFRFFRLRTP